MQPMLSVLSLRINSFAIFVSLTLTAEFNVPTTLRHDLYCFMSEAYLCHTVYILYSVAISNVTV